VYMRVDGHVYAMDLRQTVKVKVIPESYDTDTDDDEDYRRRKVSRPCSLVLQFDRVVLRIFRNQLEAFREDKETLTAVCLTLSELENAVFTVSPDDIASPSRLSACGSSGSTTVGDQGQRDESPATLLGATPPTPVGDAAAVATGKRPAVADSNNDHPTARIQRHRISFQESLASFSTVQQVLDKPVSAIASHGDDDNDSNNVNPNLSLSPLLSRTAHLVSQSYVSGSEMVAVSEHYETMLQRHEQEMEHTLSSFFPAPHRGGGRVRYNNSKVDQQPQVTGATAARAVAELVEQQKRVVEERHKLLLLPTRG
jgi:hypothetical protein